jgi:hypothetical protein
LEFDLIRYNEALNKAESGIDSPREDALAAKFPPPCDIILTQPAVVIDAGGRIILWYLPGAISDSMQVGTLSVPADSADNSPSG